MYTSPFGAPQPGFFMPDPNGYYGNQNQIIGPFPGISSSTMPLGIGGGGFGGNSSIFGFGMQQPSFGMGGFGMQQPSFGMGGFGMLPSLPSFGMGGFGIPQQPAPQESITSEIPDTIKKLEESNPDLFKTIMELLATKDEAPAVDVPKVDVEAPKAETPKAATDSGGYNPDIFDPKPLNSKWGNNDIPFDLATTQTGLYGNVHGLNAILGRYVGDNMPSAVEDPTAPGNSWIYTTRDNPWLS